MGCANTKKAAVVEKKESEPKPETEASKTEEGVKEVDLTQEVTNDDANKNDGKTDDAPTTSE